jgi:hypothetical protein
MKEKERVSYGRRLIKKETRLSSKEKMRGFRKTRHVYLT